MRLERASRHFFHVVVLALAANLTMLFVIRQAVSESRLSVAQRDDAHAVVDHLLRESDLLAALVQNYTTTGQTRYLDVYYEILAVRKGEKGLPLVDDPIAYWRERSSNAVEQPPAPEGPGTPLLGRLEREQFGRAELDAAADILRAAEAMQEVEKIAFAATQGMYDRQRQAYVDDGVPDMAYAMGLVHSATYEQARDALSAGQYRLDREVRQRTQSRNARADRRVETAVWSTIAINLALVPLFVAARVITRRRVLDPMDRLVDMAERVGGGNYTARTHMHGAPMHEVAVLARALDGMAGAIEDDIRRRDSHGRELEAARAQAEAAALAKASFLANMSHEIRTPMNAVIGMTRLALDTELSPQQRGYLTKSADASQHLLGIINDVLDYSKIEAGALQVEEAPFVLEDVVSRAMTIVRHDAQAKELELVCSFDDPALLAHRGRWIGDALRVGQVLTNLLSNAVKFTASGQVRLTLDCSAPADRPGASPELVLTISDTGIGMDAPQVQGLFREFSQADASITRRFGGTGLGLAITRRIVERMQGRIDVRSQPGAGSSFTVTLPLAVAGGAPGLGSAPEQLGIRRVLVVDDQRDTAAAVAALVHRLGLGGAGDIVEVDGGQAALRALAQARDQGRRFDLVLLDWVLPDLGGEPLLRALRQLDGEVRIVVMTAYGTQDLASATAPWGVLALIDKPVLPADLRRLWDDSLAAAAAPRADTARSLAGVRVLLVEDNELNQQLATELLERRGARVQLAVNGLEAVERLRADGAEAFDVVLMDLQMPVMDGYTAVRQIRADRRFDALPIHAMTASAMAEERQRCLAAGMQGHIAKPLDIAVLERVLLGVGSAPDAGHDAAPQTATRLSMPTLLAACDGNRTLAERLLRGFVRDYGSGVSGWAGEGLVDDRTGLIRRAHTLAGLAGTLGAGALRAAARALEAGADGAGRRQLDALLQAVDGALGEVLHAADAALGDAAPAGDDRQLPAAGGDAGEAAIDLDDLARLLRDSDSSAVHWWQAHEAQLQSRLSHVRARRLAAAMKRYDFDAALRLLEEPGVTQHGELA